MTDSLARDMRFQGPGDGRSAREYPSADFAARGWRANDPPLRVAFAPIPDLPALIRNGERRSVGNSSPMDDATGVSVGAEGLKTGKFILEGVPIRRRRHPLNELSQSRSNPSA